MATRKNRQAEVRSQRIERAGGLEGKPDGISRHATYSDSRKKQAGRQNLAMLF